MFLSEWAPQLAITARDKVIQSEKCQKVEDGGEILTWFRKVSKVKRAKVLGLSSQEEYQHLSDICLHWRSPPAVMLSQNDWEGWEEIRVDGCINKTSELKIAALTFNTSNQQPTLIYFNHNHDHSLTVTTKTFLVLIMTELPGPVKSFFFNIPNHSHGIVTL